MYYGYRVGTERTIVAPMIAAVLKTNPFARVTCVIEAPSNGPVKAHWMAKSFEWMGPYTGGQIMCG